MLAFLLGLPMLGPIVGAIGAFLKVIADTLGKILPNIVDAVTELIKVLWEGFKDILDTWQTIVFVILLCASIHVYGKFDRDGFLSCQSSVDSAIKELRREYTFVKKKVKS